jgi:hypothetical protein
MREDELEEPNEEEEDEPGDGDDEPEGGEPPPPPEPAARATGPAQRPRARRPPKNTGLGASAPFQSHLAVDLVGEIIDRLEQYPGLGKPWDLDVQVLTMDGRDRRQGDRILGSFSLYRLVGARNPGEKLQEIVTEQYHSPRTEGPDVYDIRFVWAKNTRLFSRGKLPLGSREEVTALKRAQAQAEQHSPPPQQSAQGSWSGFGAPQQQPQQPWGPPQGHWQQQPQPMPDDVQSLRAQLASDRSELQRTQGMLEEALRAAREGRQPSFGVGASPAPAPPPARESEDERIARIVAQTLRGMGLAPAAGFGAPPPPAPAPAPAAAAPTMAEKLAGTMNMGLESLVVSVAQKALDHVGKTIGDAMKAATHPPPEPEEPEEPEDPPAPPPDPMDKLSFELVPVKGLDGTPVKWPDGSPLMAGVDRETADFSFKGSLIGNPFVAGQVMKVGQTLGEAAKAAASRVSFPDGSSVVDKTPRGARDAGMGSQPERQAAPREAAPPPPPPPSPGPNGAAGGGGFPVM